MNEVEQQKIIAICIRAAQADGSQNESERAQIQSIAEGFSHEPALASAYQDAFDRELTLAQITQDVQNPDARALAYEMAVCVCNADGHTTADEQRFLDTLRMELRLQPETADPIRTQAEQLTDSVALPSPSKLAETSGRKDVDSMILNSAILAGALELLPQSMATMAILPIQLRMVYRIGQQHGFELSRGHIQDFLATAGIGLTSQTIETYARKLIGNLTRSVGGKMLGGAGRVATGSAFAFGTTYGLGQVAKQYYAGGRKLDATQLRQVFNSMINEGSALQERYANQITDKSRQIDLNNLLSLVRQT